MDIPITHLVFDAVENVVRMQGQQELKFGNKSGVTLPHPEWLAEVDEEQNENENT